MFYVYAISSLRRNYIYVGMSSNVDRRIKEHNTGKEKTTRPYLPFRLLYVESCENRVVARKREKYWKSGTGKEHIGDYYKVFGILMHRVRPACRQAGSRLEYSFVALLSTKYKNSPN